MSSIKAFSFLEVLVSLSILSFALLSLLQLQATSLDYQHEATLITKANHLLTDAALNIIYDNPNMNNAQNQRIKMQFPNGQWQATSSHNATRLQLSWKLPQQSIFKLAFELN